MTSRVLTVMFTDIQGFTDRTSKTSRQQLLSLLDAHEKLLLPVAKQFNGHLVKTIGDSLLLTYESPTNAVLSAMLMQQKLREYNAIQNDGEFIKIRIAINSGEVEQRKGDIFGEAVNIAARIEGITEADEIYFTESVYLAMNKAEVPSSEVGKRRLKGIPETIKVYRVIQDPHSDDYQSLMNNLNESNSRAVVKTPSGASVNNNVERFLKLPWIIAIACFSIIAIIFIGFNLIDPLSKPLKDINVAIENKSFGLAYSRADALYQQYPDELQVHQALYHIAEAENKQLIKTEQFDKALEKIQQVQETRKHLDLSELSKQTTWKMVQTYYPTNPFVRSKLTPLLKNHPDDETLLKDIISLMGVDTHRGPYVQALSAVILLAKHHANPLTEQEGKTLLHAMSNESAERETAAKLRKLVATRYPEGFKQAYHWLDTGKGDERLNSYKLLNEYATLTDEQRFIYHVRNLEQLYTSDRLFLYESINWLTDNKIKWQNFVEVAPKLNNLKLFNQLHNIEKTPEYKKMADLISIPLLPLVEELLLQWIDSDKLAYRANSYYFLSRSKLANKIDVGKYHQRNLTEFDAHYTPRAFKAAISYFVEQNDRSVLVTAMNTHISYKGFGRSAHNAELIKQAIKVLH